MQGVVTFWHHIFNSACQVYTSDAKAPTRLVRFKVYWSNLKMFLSFVNVCRVLRESAWGCLPGWHMAPIIGSCQTFSFVVLACNLCCSASCLNGDVFQIQSIWNIVVFFVCFFVFVRNIFLDSGSLFCHEYWEIQNFISLYWWMCAYGTEVWRNALNIFKKT